MSVAIIIPTYNERENINTLVSKIIGLPLRGRKIIIVDDNSPDGTGRIADQLAKKSKSVLVIHRKTKLGLGSAYKAGFEKAFSMGAKVVMTMDADLSHNPNIIPKMIKKIEQTDLVIGSRHTKGGKIVGFTWWRHLLSFGAQTLCRHLLSLDIYDSTSGFRAYRAEVLKKINPFSIKSEGYSFLIEAVHRAYNKGFQIAEVPITFEVRKKGKSKVSQVEIFKALGTVVKLKLSKS